MSSLSLRVERRCAAFWRRVGTATDVPAQSLGVFRWLLGLYWLAFSAPSYGFIDASPRAFFTPPALSLAQLFDGFPPAPFFQVLDAVAIVALGLMTIGYHTRAATLAVLGLRFVGASFQYSFGKIDHDILALCVLGCMVLSDWGRYYSVDARLRGQRSPAHAPERGPALLAVLLAFGMVTAGLPKALVWIDFDLGTSGVLSWLYPNQVSFGRSHLLAPYAGQLPSALLELGDYAAPALELAGFGALLHSRKLWLGWLLSLTFFHLLNALVLNISFTGYALVYCCFANLAGLGPAFERWQRVLVTAVALICSWHLFARAAGAGSPALFTSGRLEAQLLGLWSAVPVCLAVMVLLGRGLRRRAPAVTAPVVPQG